MNSKTGEQQFELEYDVSLHLFNIFLEPIITDAQKEYDGQASIGSRNDTTLRSANDEDALAEKERVIQDVKKVL